MTEALSLRGARVLLPDGLYRADIGIENGKIAAQPNGTSLDLSGFLLLPGIVDPHGDGFERHLAPRRGAVADLAAGLVSVEQELLANGITTAMLAQFWSWEGGMRGPEFAQALARALRDYRSSADLRLLLRVERGCFRDFAAIKEMIADWDIRYVVISDHVPHAALAAGRRVPRLEGQALKAGRSPAAHQALLEQMHLETEEAQAALRGFLDDLRVRGLRLGSHDDATAEMRADHRDMGLKIAEFPMTPQAAEAAQDAQDPIVLGAPNVVRGGSHQNGGMAAAGVILDGGCTALASDYHYPACRGAVRHLVAQGIALAEAWGYVSCGPADVLGMSDRGAIRPGLRADLVVTSHDLSRVHGTFCAGRLAYADVTMTERMLK
ncbi:MAG: alpha-D-ribose 1-methylphosphonate 5-triphosphate diphosphatase [Pseudomonadota bacterium]